MLTIYDHVENQLDALAIYLAHFDQFYEEDRDEILGLSLPPWRNEADRRADWFKVARRLNQHYSSARSWFDQLPVKPLRMSNSPLMWDEISHRSHCELLLYAAQHRLANLGGRKTHHHSPEDPDGMWTSLNAAAFIGEAWTETIADEAARELRRAAHGIPPIDIEDQLTETTTFGPFFAWEQDGEIWIDTEVKDEQERRINRFSSKLSLPFDVTADDALRLLSRKDCRIPAGPFAPQLAWPLVLKIFQAGEAGCTPEQLCVDLNNDSTSNISTAVTSLRTLLLPIGLTVSDARKGPFRIQELALDARY